MAGPHGPFEVPAAEIKAAWEAIGAAARPSGRSWEARFALRATTSRRVRSRLRRRDAQAFRPRIKALKKQVSEEPPKVATRKASEMALEVVNPILPETIGGSADLTGSNNTRPGDLGIFDPRTARAATSITASASTAWRRR
jgi:transketolase